jgi:glycine oxidase
MRVNLLDAGRFGDQASKAGAGMLAPGGEVDRESPWARRSVESLRLYPGFVDELQSESGIAVDYRACGAIELAYSSSELEEAKGRSEEQARLDIPSRTITPDEVRRLAPAVGTDGIAGALYYPDDAIVDPRDILRGLSQACKNRGVKICEGMRVSEIFAAPLSVMAGGARAAAGAIVLAAGAWSGDLLPGAPKSFPVKGHLVGYDLRPGALGPILRYGHTYLLQRGSGLAIAGSTMERVGFDATVNPETVAKLHRRARRLLPGLLLSSPDSSWIGFRPGIEGDEPRVERYGNTGIWLAYGHYRNGILLAPVTAQLIVDELTS